MQSRPQETPSFPQEKDNRKAESCQTPDFMDLEFDRFNGGETSDIFVHTKQYIPDAPLEGPVDLDPEFDRYASLVQQYTSPLHSIPIQEYILSSIMCRFLFLI